MRSLSTSPIWSRLLRRLSDMLEDRRGLSATEFAMIVPIMLLMLFGTVDVSFGVAVDRKAILVARTLADLTSQSIAVGDSDLNNFFAAGSAIMTPYPAAPINATISELYIDPVTKRASVQWSRGAAARATGSTVAVPTALTVGGTYLIYSEVAYLFTPAASYVIAKTGINLREIAFSRPRQSLCVLYTPATSCTTL